MGPSLLLIGRIFRAQVFCLWPEFSVIGPKSSVNGPSFWLNRPKSHVDGHNFPAQVFC